MTHNIGEGACPARIKTCRRDKANVIEIVSKEKECFLAFIRAIFCDSKMFKLFCEYQAGANEIFNREVLTGEASAEELKQLRSNFKKNLPDDLRGLFEEYTASADARVKALLN